MDRSIIKASGIIEISQQAARASLLFLIHSLARRACIGVSAASAKYRGGALKAIVRRVGAVTAAIKRMATNCRLETCHILLDKMNRMPAIGSYFAVHFSAYGFNRGMDRRV